MISQSHFIFLFHKKVIHSPVEVRFPWTIDSSVKLESAKALTIVQTIKLDAAELNHVFTFSFTVVHDHERQLRTDMKQCLRSVKLSRV